MERILPFKALRYNKNVVGNLSAVLAPPYDVISEQEQTKLYNSHPFNAVRLECGMINEGDSETDNRYTRSAETLKEWMHSGVLVPDRQPAFYVCSQEFTSADGRQHCCTGIMCLVRIDDYEKGMVLPHEETLTKAKNDRLNLMLACGANISPVYSLYADKDRTINGLLLNAVLTQPESIAKTDDKITHKLWTITDQLLISKISEALENKRLFIADGHHRYETALNYRNAMREKNSDHTGSELYNYVMMYLVEMDDPGLMIFPTHRLVKNTVGFTEQGIVSQLEENFEVEKVYAMDLEESVAEKLGWNKDVPCFAMYTGKEYYYLLKLKSFSVADEVNSEKSKALRRLDVTVLHSLILGRVLGMTDADVRNQTYLDYTREIYEAIEGVKSGNYQCSFILNPTKIHQVHDICLEKEKMPQKSTFFYPKLKTGLVMNKIN